MSDLKKLFDNAPECATEIVAWGNNLTWANKTKMYSLIRGYWVERESGWNTIATRPQSEHRKTVEDAVAQLGNATFPVATTHIGVAKISQEGWLEKGQFEFVGQDCDKNIFDLFCTIEEFEACVAAKDKSESEWTHRTKHGELCRIVLEDPDTDGYIVVLTEGYEYVKHHTALKPIKPTITTDRALWLMKTMCPDEWSALERKYTITN
ncbi:MAG: hypothetical protein WA981_03675 [Glaciecola sp.]